MRNVLGKRAGQWTEARVLAVDTNDRWLIDLQKLPAEEVVTSGLRKITPTGKSSNALRGGVIAFGGDCLALADDAGVLLVGDDAVP